MGYISDDAIIRIKNFFLFFGSLAGIYSFCKFIYQDLKHFFVESHLSIEFNPNQDIRVWIIGPPYLNITTKRNMGIVHVRNKGKIIAKQCEASLEIISSNPEIKLLQNDFSLHWADTSYQAFSSSMEKVDIGHTKRRLDIIFTQESIGQILPPGCWVASSQALAQGPTLNQFLLPPGEYKVRIKITCENGKGDTKNFVIKSPHGWSDLNMTRSLWSLFGHQR